MKKFRALRVIAVIYRILAWISLVGGIIAGLVVMAMGAMGAGSLTESMPGASRMGVAGLLGGIFTGVLVILAALLYFLLLYAMGDLIYLGLAIEENTRVTAEFLRGGRPSASMEPPAWERPPSP